MVRLKYFIIIIFLVFASTLSAQEREKGKGYRGHKGGFFEIKEKLNLSEEQKKQVKEMRQTAGMFSSYKELAHERDRLRELMKNRDGKDSEIIAQAEKVNKIQSDLNLARVKNMLAFKQILTAEQFDILSEHMEQRRSEFKAKGGKHKAFDKTTHREKNE
mgnify:CR=1 FL=1